MLTPTFTIRSGFRTLLTTYEIGTPVRMLPPSARKFLRSSKSLVTAEMALLASPPSAKALTLRWLSSPTYFTSPPASTSTNPLNEALIDASISSTRSVDSISR